MILRLLDWAKCVLLLVFGVMLIGCASTPTPTPPEPAFPPLTLPADEMPHNYLAEWWYFNGHLEANGKPKYAFHYVIFQVRDPFTNQPLYIAQVGFSDFESRHFSVKERSSDSLPAIEGNKVQIAIIDGFQEPWKMSGDGTNYELIAGTDNVKFKLKLEALGKPILHSGDGIVDFREAGISYYYSRPRLEIDGWVEVEGISEKVSGLAWLDKQWGDFIPVAISWDWASVNLSDGSDLKLSIVRNEKGVEILKYGSLLRDNGDVLHLEGRNFEFKPIAQEVYVAETGSTYPTKWSIIVPSEEINIELAAYIPQSEFISAAFRNKYWEAAMHVKGTSRGESVTGQGFVELTGRNDR